MRYHVTHTTRYEYVDAVTLSYNLVRLRPRDHGMQKSLSYELALSPTPAVSRERLDYFGNHAVWFSLQEPHTELTITARSEVQVDLVLQPDAAQSAPWEQVRETLLTVLNPQMLAAREFCFDSPYVARDAELADYARASFPQGRPLLQAVLDLTQRIHNEFGFVPGSTTVGTPVLDVLHNRRGVCQDFAHLQIGCLRSLGLAARYVSGYLATTPPPGQPRLAGADASHAWVSVFEPDFGWMDFDPTNGIIPSDSHVTVAWARDYDDVGPVKGILVGGRRQRLKVSVDVTPAGTSQQPSIGGVTPA
ncbi:MAG TPA: transglutaminase family protein [Terriglobales bacterium]|nr:transglutaminase family protein [Terriglobales bacterium]